MRDNLKIKKDMEGENKFGQMVQCMKVISKMTLPMGEDD